MPNRRDSDGDRPSGQTPSIGTSTLLDLLHLALDHDLDELSLAPAGAGVAQREWDDLPEDERRSVQLRHLRAIDPRLLANTVLNARGLFAQDELLSEQLRAGH